MLLLRSKELDNDKMIGDIWHTQGVGIWDHSVIMRWVVVYTLKYVVSLCVACDLLLTWS